MKKILALTSLILVLFVSVCSAEKNSPAEDLKIFCKATFQGDEVSLKQIGMTKKDYENLIASKFIGMFDDINLSKYQESRIIDSILNIFKRSEFETETVSENENTAQVKFTVSTFEPFTEQLVEKKLNEYTKVKFPPNFNLKNLSDDEKKEFFTDCMVYIFDGLQIIGMESFVVECSYSNEFQLWTPKDSTNFGKIIVDKTFNGVK